MKMFLAGALIAFAFPLFAQSPCKSKREQKHTSRKQLMACIKAWGEATRMDASDPNDDCSAKLVAFVQAVKDLKACRLEQKKAKENP